MTLESSETDAKKAARIARILADVCSEVVQMVGQNIIQRGQLQRFFS